MDSLVLKSDGELKTTSRLIAHKFGKRHADVIRAIETLDCSEEFNERNFALVNYQDEKNETRPEYIVTRDGFTFLAMGFRGKKAARFKEDYIMAFNEAEKTLKQKPTSTLDFLELSIKSIRENKQELTELKQEVNLLKAKTTTRPNYFTVVGYGTLNNIPVNVKLASSIGRKAAAICKKRGIDMDSIPDARFGKVRLYPISVLEEVFSNSLA